jgi:hypothetical protein
MENGASASPYITSVSPHIVNVMDNNASALPYITSTGTHQRLAEIIPDWLTKLCKGRLSKPVIGIPSRVQRNLPLR